MDPRREQYHEVEEDEEDKKRKNNIYCNQTLRTSGMM